MKIPRSQTLCLAWQSQAQGLQGLSTASWIRCRCRADVASPKAVVVPSFVGASAIVVPFLYPCNLPSSLPRHYAPPKYSQTDRITYVKQQGLGTVFD